MSTLLLLFGAAGLLICGWLIFVIGHFTIRAWGAPIILGLLAWGAFAVGWAPIGWAFAIVLALLLALVVILSLIALVSDA